MNGESKLLKSDTIGRVRMSLSKREEILDEFERRGLSDMAYRNGRSQASDLCQLSSHTGIPALERCLGWPLFLGRRCEWRFDRICVLQSPHKRHQIGLLQRSEFCFEN